MAIVVDASALLCRLREAAREVKIRFWEPEKLGK